jgi:hypothetical protein
MSEKSGIEIVNIRVRMRVKVVSNEVVVFVVVNVSI